MGWVVKLEEVINGKVVHRSKVATLDCPTHLHSLDDLGLRLADAKTLLACLQTKIITRQIKHDAKHRSHCPTCGGSRRLKDYRPRKFDTLFGRIEVGVPRFDAPDCGCDGAGNHVAPSALRGRSTPEYDAIRAKLAAQLPYRAAAKLLADLLPVCGGATHTTFRNRTFSIAEQIITNTSERAAMGSHEQPASALTVQLDHTYIRAAQGESARHLAVLAGMIEHDEDGLKRCFASLDEQREPATIVREQLNLSGYTPSTTLTALTDGDEGLRNIARSASEGSIEVILDWFHLAMRLRPLEQIAQGLRTRVRSHVEAKIQIVDALDHLHWRLWHGKFDTLAECYEKVKVAVGAFRRYTKGWLMRKGPRDLMTGLQELRRYIKNNAGTMVNYHQRQCAGLCVSSCGVESTVNYLINHRMNKRQQMRWTRRGAHLLLQVRAAVLNGEFDAMVRPSSGMPEYHNDEDFSLPLAA